MSIFGNLYSVSESSIFSPGQTIKDDISMENHRIINLGAGVSGSDAVNKAQLDALTSSLSSTYLPLAGGFMTGNIDLNTQRLTSTSALNFYVGSNLTTLTTTELNLPVNLNMNTGTKITGTSNVLIDVNGGVNEVNVTEDAVTIQKTMQIGGGAFYLNDEAGGATRIEKNTSSEFTGTIRQGAMEISNRHEGYNVNLYTNGLWSSPQISVQPTAIDMYINSGAGNLNLNGVLKIYDWNNTGRTTGNNGILYCDDDDVKLYNASATGKVCLNVGATAFTDDCEVEVSENQVILRNGTGNSSLTVADDIDISANGQLTLNSGSSNPTEIVIDNNNIKFNTTATSGSFIFKSNSGGSHVFIEDDNGGQFTLSKQPSDAGGGRASVVEIRNDETNGKIHILTKSKEFDPNLIVDVSEVKLGVSLNANSKTVVNLIDPTNGTDAATKNYVDNHIGVSGVVVNRMGEGFSNSVGVGTIAVNGGQFLYLKIANAQDDCWYKLSVNFTLYNNGGSGTCVVGAYVQIYDTGYADSKAVTVSMTNHGTTPKAYGVATMTSHLIHGSFLKSCTGGRQLRLFVQNNSGSTNAVEFSQWDYNVEEILPNGYSGSAPSSAIYVNPVSGAFNYGTSFISVATTEFT